jgi:HlyD family secretion protein
MIKFKTVSLLFVLIQLIACNSSNNQFDAQGSFEADEILVSPEVNGRIEALTIKEGDSLSAGQVVGQIESKNLALQKEQVEASIQALSQKTTSVQPQVDFLNEQLALQSVQLKNAQKEYHRIEGLFKKDAATAKQVDDLGYQVEAIQKQIDVTKEQIRLQKAINASQNKAILSEKEPLEKRVAQLSDLVNKTAIVNPVKGTVLVKYAEVGEIAMGGKALYKVADLSSLTLRAYITGDQLAELKIGQPVTVFVDKGEDDYIEYKGTLTWVSSKAEFTPKTIQTKDERANLVYAIKVNVKNDGLLKIGMYAEVKF